jgi:PncC family amidohydrolase
MVQDPCERRQETLDNVTEAAARIGKLLVARGWTLGTAESCTGGLVSHSITNVAGSSAFFLGGVVAYDNRIKHQVLQVPEALLAAHGAVSREAVLAMAQGVRRLLGVDVGIATSGIAGPTGGTPGKPVGTVFIAVASPAGDQARHHLFQSDRQGNKRLSAEAVLALLEEQLR